MGWTIQPIFSLSGYANQGGMASQRAIRTRP